MTPRVGGRLDGGCNVLRYMWAGRVETASRRAARIGVPSRRPAAAGRPPAAGSRRSFSPRRHGIPTRQIRREEASLAFISGHATRVGLARKFHTLLAGEATECSENCHAVGGRWDFRTYVKTAWRFCFSPHELKATAKTPMHRASGRREEQSECEKCGLGFPGRVAASAC